jgi:RNA polymerase sigma-54 factor
VSRIGFSQRLELRQSQALVMTPQLQQAIKMLQLSNLELAEFVDAEIEQNPLLERGEREPDAPAREEPVAAPEPTGPEAAAGEVAAEAAEHWQAASGDEGDGSFDRGGDAQSWRSRGGSADGDYSAIEHAPARARTLREHLSEQFGADLPDPADRVIGNYLLDQLDEAGYLLSDIAEAADKLGCTGAQVGKVLSRLQELDPPGVFARTLPECLALQLRDHDRLDPAMQRLLDNLPLLAARNVPALTRICGVDAEDLAQMVVEIKALDPRMPSTRPWHRRSCPTS